MKIQGHSIICLHRLTFDLCSVMLTFLSDTSHVLEKAHKGKEKQLKSFVFYFAHLGTCIQ